VESEDERKHFTIQRVDDLLREQDFPGTAIRAAAKRLAIVRAELDELKVREVDAKHNVPWDGKEIRKRCRNLRKEYLLPISRAAKAIEGFMEHTPNAKAALRVPHLTESAEKHVEAGERFATFLKTHRAGFLKETKFDRDILSKLRAATDELRAQSRFATRWRKERSALIREIKSLLKRGRNQIGLLASMLEPLLIARKLVGSWERAGRVGVKLGRKRDTPQQRAAKAVDAAKKKKEKLDEQHNRREARKAALRAKKAQLAELAELRKQKRQRKPAAVNEPPGVAPAPPPPAEPPLTKAVFLERLAEEGGEIER
jgi:hypothetical protein